MRTNLIIAMQEAEARGYAVWRSQQDEAVLTVWPAQELYRAQFRQKPRDWRTRWNEARADLGEGNTSATYAVSASGPFVALRGDPPEGIDAPYRPHPDGYTSTADAATLPLSRRRPLPPPRPARASRKHGSRLRSSRRRRST